MARSIGLKLLLLIPVVFLVSVATFMMTDLLPGDPAVAILGESFQAYHMLAIVLVLGGIWLAEHSSRKLAARNPA